jgi:DNA-binding NarL/FixJ family response regulator
VAEPISFLIADDHEHIRAGPRPACRRPDVEVVGEAGTGEQTVALAARLQPDVVLMDLQMPGLGGIDATTRILHTSPHIRVVVVSMFDGDSVFAALQAGARGYLLKGAQGRDPAVHPRGRQRRGDPRPDHRHQADALPRRAPPEPALDGLPRRLPRTYRARAGDPGAGRQHHTNPEIARSLHVSPKTVRNHASNIFTKLHVVTRAGHHARS